ncbi:hypothetical protein PCASD_22651 [Puccinia coronata f. sp. avenae]|uniref:Methyltransferase domain-containing protein n=1 Tax=Puccinia coronata f. sp. avenae TaxID=200324 RepID=A0A2N5S1X5_9BASI|nr:hypothetical protein PCASD_22651 [Puccinia coronata f. sp. avenae]
MTAAYRQDKYMLQEPSDREIIKHDRAHHRNFKNHSRHHDSDGKSRIKKFFKKSTSSQQTAPDSGSDIHSELPFNSPISFLSYQASASGEAAGLDIQALSRSQSQFTSRSSRSLTGIRHTGWRTTDKASVIGKKLGIKQTGIKTGLDSEPLAEELSKSQQFHPDTSTFSNHPGSKTASAQSNLYPLAPQSHPRQPRLSISKSFLQTYFTSPKPSQTWAPSLDVTSEIGLCSAPELEIYSEHRPMTSFIDSHQSSSLSKFLRKSTLEPKINLTGLSNLWLPTDSPLHDSSEAQPVIQDNAFHLQESSPAALDQKWFARTRGEKYHPCARSELPYWMSYGTEVMNHHLLMQYASSILQGSSPFELDFSPSEKPSPTIGIRRVLDIGCGPSATWCVGVLRETRGVEVTGLDVCPLLLDLRSLESSVSENFTFVKYDFLNDALPFASESFDYVHSSFISSGVPEHKWSHLLEEMARILKPQGTLEILECNMPTADPSQAKTPKYPNIEFNDQGASFCRVPAARAPTIGPGSTLCESESLMKESTPEVGPTTVKEMLNKLLEQQFISPYPLSILPSEISSVTTGLRRPLANQVIRFPSDLQGFADLQTKSLLVRTTLQENDSLKSVASNDPDAQAAALECMGMLLLHSHVDAMYANKEISWCNLWLPSISCETSNSMPAISVKRTRPAPSSFGRYLDHTRRDKLISPTRKVKSKHYDRTGVQPAVEKRDGYNPKHSIFIPWDGLMTFHDKFHSASHLNLHSTNFAGTSSLDLPLDHLDSTHHHQVPEKLTQSTLRDSSSAIFTHRKNFDQIWNVWKDDLNCSSVGISKLLELRFGWTCTMDIQHYKALHEHQDAHQHELSQCEFRINELRHKLQERKFSFVYSHASETNTSLDENPCAKLSSRSQTFSLRKQRPLSFEYETSSEDHEDFEHVNFAKSAADHPSAILTDPRLSSENPVTSYENNVVHHESDSQSLEELGSDTQREYSNLRQEVTSGSVSLKRRSSDSLVRPPSLDLVDTRSLNGKFNPAPSTRGETESDNDEGFVNDGQVSLKPFLSSSIISSDRVRAKEQEHYGNLELEIDILTRQKGEIKKAIRLIQNDLDNVARRLGLSDSEDHQLFAIPSAGAFESIIQTDKDEFKSAPTIKKDSGNTNTLLSKKEVEGNGTLGDLFLPLDNLEFSTFLRDERLKSPSVSAELTSHGNRMEKEKDYSRIPNLNCSVLSGRSNRGTRPTKNMKHSSYFTSAGFGDLKIEKFYSVKQS